MADSEHQKLFDERMARCETAAHNGTPDRVPNVTLIGTLPQYYAGITMADTIRDHSRSAEATYNFFKQYPQFDTAGIGAFMTPAGVFENLGAKNARWPGDGILDENNTYQFIEYPTMMEDEYDEVINSPCGFYFSKLLPRQYSVFDSFADTNWTDAICGMGSSLLANPGMIPMYQRLLAAATEQKRCMDEYGPWQAKLDELGFYSISGGGSATAFDLIGDTLRGTMGFMPDLIEQRDKVKELIDIFCGSHIRQSVGFCKAFGVHYGWVMLHKGFDGFISDEDYAELYWPSLQKWILALIDNGITPVVYTEGAYNTRLKYLKDVPENKVIYHFENVDIKLAKKELGDVAAIMGAFPEYTLRYGTKEQVIDKVKETLDVLAPGGGYLFTTNYSVDVCPRENLEAMLDTVEAEGKY